MHMSNRTLSSATRWLRPVFAAGALAGLAAMSAPAADVKPAIDPKADALLRRMSACLTQEFYSVSAEIWQDIQLESG